MGKEKDTYKIFSTTGCLTEVGLSRYTKHLLSKSELLLAEEHIKSCNLCSDAIDGYKAFNNIDLFAENTKVLKKKIKSRHRKSNRNRIFYYSAAASLLIVIMTSVLYHQTSGKLNIEDKEFTLNDPKTEIATYAKENIAMNMAAKLDDTEKKIRSKNGGITNPKVAAPIVSASKEIETKKVVDVISEKASVNTSIEEPLESIVYEDKKELQEEAEEKVLAKKADGARAAADKSSAADKAYPSSDELESVGYSSRKRASAPIKNKAVYSLTYTRFEDYIYSKMSVNTKESLINCEMQLSFELSAKGETSEIKIIKGCNNDSDKEIINIIKNSDKWLSAATENGVSVKSFHELHLQIKP